MPHASSQETGKRLTTAERARDIGVALRRRRVRSGLTQEELARMADVSVGTVKSLESGRGSSLRSVIRVSRALGVDGWIDSLVAQQEPSISPMKLLKDQQASLRGRGAVRRRATGALRTD
jgi:transcriptional regulator with XRE-family HTH domain